MKKKHIKFKPLQELYDHGDSLFEPKVKLSVHQASVEELSLVRKDHNSCQSLHSEEFQSMEYSKTPVLSEDLLMLQNKSSCLTTDFSDCQGDNSSTISKDVDAIMISSNSHVGADHKSEISRAPSVDSSSPDMLEKSLNGQTIRIGSLADQLSVEEGDKSSMMEHKHASEDERDDLNHEVNEKTCILANTETQLSDGLPPALILNNKSDSPITSTEEFHLQSKDIKRGNGPEALVDVRVCDICGDVGREALLVLCSKCSDGAEHIYCMSPKMDEVPENDWLCEECWLTQDRKRLKQTMVEQSESVHVLIKSSAKIETAVIHADERMKPHLGVSSGLFHKKRRSPRLNIKKRTDARQAQPLKISSASVKIVTAVVNSLTSIDKDEYAARQVSSFVNLPATKVVTQTCSSGDRSSKSEQKFCGGSLNSDKSVTSSDSNMEARHSFFVYKRRKSSKNNDCGKLKKGLPENKASKSLCSTGDSSVPMDVSNVQSYESGKNSSKKCYSPVNETNQQVLSIASSGPMEVSSSGNNVISNIFEVANSSKRNVEDEKAVQLNGNSNGKGHDTLAHEGNNSVNLSCIAGSDEERKSPCQLRCTIEFTPDIVNAYGDQRMNLATQDSGVDDLTRDNDDHNYMKVDSTLDRKAIDHVAPFAISAVPESSCIWRGIFKLENSDELPTDCYGVQAHLSNFALPKFAELVFKFPRELLLKKVPQSQTWPIEFQENQPTELDIPLSFYAQDLSSYRRSYGALLESMTKNDLALEASCGDFELLVFPSSLLPATSQCSNSLPFLWGVFRAGNVDGYTLLSPTRSIDTLDRGFYPTVTCGSDGEFVFPPVSGTLDASFAPHHFIQEAESVSPVVLQSLVWVKAEDQSTEHEEPSPDNITFPHAWGKEDYGLSLRNYDVQVGNRFSGEDLKSVKSEVDNFQSDIFIQEPANWTGLCSDGNYRSPDSVYELSTHEPTEWHYLGFLVKRSESSDGGGGATSADEPQMDPLRLHNDVSLNLCLGNGSKSEETINLDLALALPTNNKYPPNNFFKDEKVSQDGDDVSLVLSLGLPCTAC